jgi:hypothetical protein
LAPAAVVAVSGHSAIPDVEQTKRPMSLRVPSGHGMQERQAEEDTPAVEVKWLATVTVGLGDKGLESIPIGLEPAHGRGCKRPIAQRVPIEAVFQPVSYRPSAIPVWESAINAPARLGEWLLEHRRAAFRIRLIRLP